jgi:hypothetical protein
MDSNASMTTVQSSVGRNHRLSSIAGKVIDGKLKRELCGESKQSKHSFKAHIASESLKLMAEHRFFSVTLVTPGPTLPLENLISAAIEEATNRDEDHQRTLNIIKDSMSLVTKTPWLRRTRWEEMFAGKDMNMLNQLAHSPDLRDGDMQLIWSSVDRVLRDCFRGVLDCHARGWELVLFWMASVDRNKEDTKPFRTHMELRTMARYIGYWQQYVMFCIRAITTDDSVPFTLTIIHTRQY